MANVSPGYAGAPEFSSACRDLFVDEAFLGLEDSPRAGDLESRTRR